MFLAELLLALCSGRARAKLEQVEEAGALGSKAEPINQEFLSSDLSQLSLRGF